MWCDVMWCDDWMRHKQLNNIIRALSLEKRTRESYLCWTQFLCLVAVVLTIADMLQTILAVSVRCCKLLPRASHAAMRWNSLQLNPSDIKVTKLSLQIMQFTINSEIKIPRPLSQATASDNSEVFILTLPLPGGRTDEAWEPCRKWWSPPPQNVSLTYWVTFAFVYSSFQTSEIYILYKGADKSLAL
jgi:hypothetical protein